MTSKQALLYPLAFTISASSHTSCLWLARIWSRLVLPLVQVNTSICPHKPLVPVSDWLISDPVLFYHWFRLTPQYAHTPLVHVCHWLASDPVCFSIGPGEHLRLCPQDYTCCSSQMEETLAHQSETDFLSAIDDTSQFLLTTFTQRHHKFDGELECKSNHNKDA